MNHRPGPQALPKPAGPAGSAQAQAGTETAPSQDHLLATLVPLCGRDPTKWARFLRSVKPVEWGRVFQAIHQEPSLGNGFACEISRELTRMAAAEQAPCARGASDRAELAPDGAVPRDASPEPASNAEVDAGQEESPEVDGGVPVEVDASVDPAEPEPDMSGTARHLTVGEIGYAEEIFWGTVNYRAIQITRNRALSTGAARTVGNTIHMNTDVSDGESDFEKDDFGRWTMELTAHGLNTLVHEMTHVWQYQNGGIAYASGSLAAQGAAWLMTGSRDGAYDWREAVMQGRLWEKWGPEQQGQCVQDFDTALRRTRQRAAQKELPHLADIETMRVAQPFIDRLRAGKGAPEPGRGHAAAAGVVGGAILGGPAGAVVGGVVGYLVGDD